MKKIFTALLCALVFFTFCIFSASAANYSGECGESGNNVTWALDTSTGILNISGSGAMKDYTDFSKVPWKQYLNYIKTVSVANGVTSIGMYAFYKCTTLTQVILPDTLTALGYGAFEECKSLASVTIPGSVTTFAGSVFSNCTALESISLPGKITSIGEYAFYNCSSLTTVTLSNNLTTIGKGAFSSCTALANITLSDRLTTISDEAFRNTTSLKTITIPNGVTSIGNGAFRSCGLTEIAVPSSVKTLGSNAFAYSKKLYRVNLLGGISSVGEHAFGSCPALKTVLISDSVTTIGKRAFAECTAISTITLPSALVTIDVSAFEDCTSLKTVDIPSSVKYIDSYAFYNCSALSKAVINSKSVMLYDYVFYGTATDFKLHGYTGSTAQAYANEYGHAFVSLDVHTHTYKLKNIAPTRETDAAKTMICDCGDVLSKATVKPTAIEPTFMHNVRFEAAYSLLFAVKFSDLANTTDFWAEFKSYNYDDNGKLVTNKTVVDAESASSTQKVFVSPGISAKQMNDKIEVTYYCIANGVKYKSQTDTYNLVDYYFTQKGKGTNLEKLLIEMLNYGAAAQKQLDNYNVKKVVGDRYTGLVNQHLATELQKNSISSYSTVTASTVRNPHGDTDAMSYQFKANNGRFLQKISVLYAFTPIDGMTDYAFENLVFKGTYEGLNDANTGYVTKRLEVSGGDGCIEKSGTMIIVVVDKLSVKDLRATIVNGALYDHMGNRISETVDSGFECYVNSATNTSESMKLLMKATLCYSDAAKNYFENK